MKRLLLTKNILSLATSATAILIVTPAYASVDHVPERYRLSTENYQAPPIIRPTTVFLGYTGGSFFTKQEIEWSVTSHRESMSPYAFFWNVTVPENRSLRRTGVDFGQPTKTPFKPGWVMKSPVKIKYQNEF